MDEREITDGELLNSLLEEVPYAVFLADERGRFIKVNRAACEQLGYTREELLSLGVLDIVGEKARNAAKEKLSARKAGGGFLESRHRHKDGTEFQVELDVKPINYGGRAARASQEFYRTLMQAMPDFICALDTDGRITYCNRRLPQFREDPTGKIRHEAFPKEAADAHLEAIKKVMSTGEPSTRVEEVVYPDRKVFLENRLFPVKDESGRIAGLIRVTRDISDQKKAEERLRDSEERYRQIFDNAADPIFVHDTEGRILEGNQAVKETYGYNREELRSLSVDQIGTPEYAASIPDRMKTLLSAGAVRFSASHRKKNGEVLSADVRDSLITWQGRPAIMSVCRDMTARVKTQEELKRSEEKFSLVFHSSPSAQIISRVSDGRIIEANEVFVKESGYPREELIGSTTIALRLWDTEAASNSAVEALRKNGIVRNLRIVFRRKSGETFPADYSAALFRLGEDLCVISSVTDLSECRRAEAALMEVQRLESMGLLAGGLAHDFNNMLAGIMGNLSLLEMDLVGSKKKMGYVAEALEGVNSCRSLMAQFAAFAKGTKPARKRFSLCSVVHRSAALAITGTNCALKVKTPETLPDIEGDEGQVFQAVSNIVLNATQAMPGGGTVAVELSEFDCREGCGLPLAPGPYVRIDVADTGIGMPPEVLARMFAPYFSTKGKGRGLGLAMAFSVARGHGGHIEAASEQGKGTRFSVYLPCLESNSPCVQIKPARPKLHKGSGLVLVLEDDESVTGMLTAMLKASGYTPVAAADGKTALRLFGEKGGAGSFAAVIMDLVIPGGMGGQKCLEEIRKRDPLVAAVATSGYSDYPVMAGPEKYGFDSALPKPYSSEEFGNALSAALEKASARSRDDGKTRKRSKK